MEGDFGDVGVGERERSMVVDVQVWKRGEVPEAAGAQDWTGLDWAGGQGESTREGVCQFGLLAVSTRISAMKLGKYLGQRAGIQVPTWQTAPGKQRPEPPGAPSPRQSVGRFGTAVPGCCIGYGDSTIETGPAHWFQGWFDVRLSQPKLGWDADSVRRSSLQIVVDLQHTSC